ncbi:MAG: TrkH family potassium uptake protein [Oscillospiraceae bacterium]|nr:TrkH family potassium uptake protein [Oscillospiraceae bacterium]
MNFAIIRCNLGLILRIFALLMLLPVAVGLIYGENILNFVLTIAATLLVSLLLSHSKPKNRRLFAKEGFVIVAIAWILISALGALPFVISGSIPNYIDAFFETVSGFTTTGSSVVSDIELMPRSDLFWRCFTHWIGGMGVLVFAFAIMPLSSEHSMHLMRAEVPGPTVAKLVPRTKSTARILYIIYLVLTLVQTVLLMLGGLSLYDALLHSFATAGTGGFSTYSASIAHFDSVYVEMVCSVFMLIFSVNFGLYFLVLIGRPLQAIKNEELRWFGSIVVGTTLAIAVGISGMFDSFPTALRHAFFNVCSIISTTGFCTVDFNLWPEFTKWLLILLMFCGACAGSTGGGLKVSRIAVLLKCAVCEVRETARPRSINRVRLDGKALENNSVHGILVFFLLYICLFLLFAFIISFDGFDVTTTFTAALTCISNVGPGLSLVGPTGNFAIFSPLSKLALSFAMLFGRLEIYPLIVLLSRSTWRR